MNEVSVGGYRFWEYGGGFALFEVQCEGDGVVGRVSDAFGLSIFEVLVRKGSETAEMHGRNNLGRK